MPFAYSVEDDPLIRMNLLIYVIFYVREMLLAMKWILWWLTQTWKLAYLPKGSEPIGPNGLEKN